MAPQAPFGFEIWWRKPTTSSIRPHAHTVGAGGAAGAPLFGTEGCQGPAHCLNLHPSANFRTCIAVFCTRPLTLGLKIFILPIGGAQSATFWHKVGLTIVMAPFQATCNTQTKQTNGFMLLAWTALCILCPPSVVNSLNERSQKLALQLTSTSLTSDSIEKRIADMA